MLYEEKNKLINQEDQPLVSIITPLYNAASFISQTISSIQNQTYTNWEHIIVDDASTDDSIRIVEAILANEPRIKLLKTSENNGAAVCRNLATKEASGDFIAFLDSDDLWHPQKLENQLRFMRNEKCAVSHTSYLQIDDQGNSLNKRIRALSSISFKKQHSNNYIGNLTGMYDVREVGKIIAPNIRKRQDWAVWLEAIKRSGKPALGLQEDLAYYRIRDGSMSSNKFNLIQYNFRFYKEYLGYSWPASVFYLLCFFWEYFLVRPKQIENL